VAEVLHIEGEKGREGVAGIQKSEASGGVGEVTHGENVCRKM